MFIFLNKDTGGVKYYLAILSLFSAGRGKNLSRKKWRGESGLSKEIAFL
jgi:hypothetical protein